MRVLVDTNVVLDLLLDREPWSGPAAELFTEIEAGTVEGYLGATTVTTIHYLATKAVGPQGAQQQIRGLLALCTIAPVDHRVLAAALDLRFADFEDAVLHEAAQQVNADAIVTRDTRGFRKAKLKILTPIECVRILQQRAAGPR